MNLKIHKKGFSLVELLVAIAIVGILSSVIFANIIGSKAKGRNNVRIQALDALKDGMTLYYDMNKSYPKTCTDSTCSNPLKGNVGWVGICSLFNYNGSGFSGAGAVTDTGDSGWIPGLAPGYVLKLPRETFFTTSGQCYIYKSDGKDYKILAYQTVEGGNVPSNHFFRDPGNRLTSYAVYTEGARTW